jgi:hypothetical protein
MVPSALQHQWVGQSWVFRALGHPSMEGQCPHRPHFHSAPAERTTFSCRAAACRQAANFIRKTARRRAPALHSTAYFRLERGAHRAGCGVRRMTLEDGCSRIRRDPRTDAVQFPFPPEWGRHRTNERSTRATTLSSPKASAVSTTIPANTVFTSNTPSACRMR